MHCFVYWNFHKRLYSIRAEEGENKGLVLAHANKLLLERPTFRVSEAGRDRVIAEDRKNVHAGVVGKLVAMVGETYEQRINPASFLWQGYDERLAEGVRNQGRFVRYNPRKAGYFFYEEGEIGYMQIIPVDEGMTAYMAVSQWGTPDMYVAGSQRVLANT
jgi:hypothetical protein